MGKWCLHTSLFLGNKDMFKNYKRFDFWHVHTADIGLLIKVAGKKDMHKSLQEFDFWHIQTAGQGGYLVII